MPCTYINGAILCEVRAQVLISSFELLAIYVIMCYKIYYYKNVKGIKSYSRASTWSFVVVPQILYDL